MREALKYDPDSRKMEIITPKIGGYYGIDSTDTEPAQDDIDLGGACGGLFGDHTPARVLYQSGEI